MPNSMQSASMGPRLVGRGKAVVLGKGNTRVFSFNGAASCGTRKDILSEEFPIPAHGFNGAASCGTRKDNTATSYYQIRLRLQWGRVLWDAERSSGSNSTHSISPSFNGAASCGTRKGLEALETKANAYQASMGPRLVGRGKTFSRIMTCSLS